MGDPWIDAIMSMYLDYKFKGDECMDKPTCIILEGGECSFKSTVAAMLCEEFSGVIHKRQRVADPFERLRTVMNDIAEVGMRTRVFRDTRLHIYDRWELISDIVYEKYQYHNTSVFEDLLPVIKPKLREFKIVIFYLRVSDEVLTERFNARGDKLLDLDMAIKTNRAYDEFFDSDSAPGFYCIDTSNKTSQQVFEQIKDLI